MSEYTAEVLWELGEQDFLANRYSRRHRIRFDGGIEVAGSSSAHVVPIPMSDPSAVDPEEAFVAALASCHMLWFLALAARKGHVVVRYRDLAVGVMERNTEGRLAITVVTLNPDATFANDPAPSRDDIDRLHHAAHEACFIANSVRSEIRCHPVYPSP